MPIEWLIFLCLFALLAYPPCPLQEKPEKASLHRLISKLARICPGREGTLLGSNFLTTTEHINPFLLSHHMVQANKVGTLTGSGKNLVSRVLSHLLAVHVREYLTGY